MAIYKTRNPGMWHRMRVMQGTRGMFTTIPGNVLILAFRECSKRFQGMFDKILGKVIKDSGECSRRFQGILLKIPGQLEKIPGNAREDSGECSRRFQGMFQRIPGNIPADSGKCSERFRGMLKKIPLNLNFNLLLEILLVFIKFCC